MFIGFGLTNFAQISFDKDSAELVYVDKDLFDYSQYSIATNNSVDANDTVFTWTRIEDIPSNWETAVCEDELCFPTTKSSNDINIGIGKEFKMKLNYYAYGNKDCGSGQIVLSSKINPSNTDTFYSRICTFNSASVKEIRESFSVYPNPTKDKVYIKTLNNGYLKVRIYNILGSLQITKNVISGESINVSTLPKGVYIVKIEGDSNSAQTFQKM